MLWVTPFSVTDPRNNVTTSTYDANRRLLQFTGPAPQLQTEALTYDDNGQVIKTQVSSASEANSEETVYSYTIDGKRSTAQTSANFSDGSQPIPEIFEYDNLRRLHRVMLSDKSVATADFDALSRPTAHYLNGNLRLAFSYSNNGRLKTLTDSRSKTTTFVYDGFDRGKRTEYPNGSFDELTFDGRDNIQTARTRSGAVFSFTHDDLNRMSSKASCRTADRHLRIRRCRTSEESRNSGGGGRSVFTEHFSNFSTILPVD